MPPFRRNLPCNSTRAVFTRRWTARPLRSMLQLAAFAAMSSAISRRAWIRLARAVSIIVALVVVCPVIAQNFVSTGFMQTNRYNHTATLLPNGKVLVAGGIQGAIYDTAASSAELFDPATGSFSPTGSMITGRDLHTATLLPNGKVLIVGGWNYFLHYLSFAELYDPATGTFNATTTYSTATRSNHTATLLPNGKVLIVGGADDSTYRTSAELYDPVLDTFTATVGSMTTGRAAHTATLLQNGKVLIAGGLGAAGYLSSAELYDPVTDTFTPTTGSLSTARQNHTATLLHNGNVLIAGGYNGSYLASAEVYDPGNKTFSAAAAPLATGRDLHTSTLLPNGTVLIAGGERGFRQAASSAELYDPNIGTFSATSSSMVTSRYAHTATLLQGGRVLLAGGYDNGSLRSSVEMYEPATGSFTSTVGPMSDARSHHTATMLPNGKVLVAGGYYPDYFTSADLYDPASNTFIPTTGPMTVGRYDHTATLLPSGKVLMAGSASYTKNAELFDPGTGTFAGTTGIMTTGRARHTATLLPNGKVLLAGGQITDGYPYVTSDAELFDPSSATFSATSSLTTARGFHTATLLPDGTVLIAGGKAISLQALSSAEIYDPITGTFHATATPMLTARYSHTATLLPNGKVLIAGGTNGGVVLSSAELYDPASRTFSALASLASPREFHTATLLLNGKVLLAGGTADGTYSLASAELYDPANGTFTTTAGSLATERNFHTATLLPDGRVLIGGGLLGNSFASGLTSAELFSMDSSDPGRRPTITFLSSSIAFGASLTITGNLFGGDSEASGGSTASSASNYPLISLLSIEGGQLLRITPDSRCGSVATCNFSDDPMSLTISNLPSSLNTGSQMVTVTTNGVPSVSRFVTMSCGPPVITSQPANTTTNNGTPATFSVAAQGGRTYQWRQNGSDIPGATGPSYTTPNIDKTFSGSSFDVVINSGCGTVISAAAILTVADATAPAASIIAPSGGEYVFLSPPAGPASTQTITWSMSDNIAVCQLTVSLLYSDDGDNPSAYVAAPAGGGLPYSAGSSGSCRYPGILTTSRTYTVPTSFPSGKPGSLYKIQLVLVDASGNATTVVSANPFFFVQNDPQVATLILWNRSRMVARQGVSNAEADLLGSKLQYLAAHPLVRGQVVDLGAVSAVTSLYATWDSEPSNPDKANAVLFGTGGIHDYVTTSLLAAYPAVKYLVLVGDDRIIPMARVEDRTSLFPESSYPAGGDITSSATTVGQALAAGKYLTDDPLAVISSVTTNQLNGSLFIPDLSVGRLVETPQEIVTTIASFISQDGLLDLTLLDASTGHKVLVTGYDFLANPAIQIRKRWKSALGVSTPNSSLAPVDGSLMAGNWGIGSVSGRVSALRTHLNGNGAARYGVMGIAGHATHYEEGVPGTSATDIEGLSTADIYGTDACNDPTLGALDLSGSVVYSLGCHGGLSVPGSCRSDADHSLDLPQTMLARGVVTYVANSGYGWGLLNGIGYGGRLAQIFTEQMTSAGSFAVGDIVRLSKQRYYLETPRYDPYDEKTVMQWMVYGLPMYTVKTGITSSAAVSQKLKAHRANEPFGRVSEETIGAVRVKRVLSAASSGRLATQSRSPAMAGLSLPSYLTQLTLSFDFTATGVYEKHDSDGNVLDPGAGCPDVKGCYYTLNGLTDRGTGSGDLPIQPYLIYDSRLSGTSQHGVLWKGGTYDEESNWIPVFAQLVSNGGDGSNHGAAPRLITNRPTAPRVVPGGDSPNCRVSDLEVNSLTLTAGEAVKNQTSDVNYSIARRYRNIDLEVFYYNNQTAPSSNCDRNGPSLGPGPFGGQYHQVSGSTISWAVPATDPAGVWRVLIVYNANAVDGQGRGTWTPLDLTNDGTGTYRGNVTISGTPRATYVIEAVDNRGNVTWLDYVSAQLPSSGIPLGVPNAVDAALSGPVSAPTGMLAAASSSTSVTMTWNSVNGAASYDVYRSASGTAYSKIGSSGTTGFTDGTAAANTAYLYAVKSIDAGSNASLLSSPDLATTVVFIDPSLTAGSTVIKAAHIAQLRTAVNAVRTLAAMSAYSFTDTTLAAGLTRAKAVHITDLRAALDAARTTLNLTPLVYTNPTISVGLTAIKAADIDDLRHGVQ